MARMKSANWRRLLLHHIRSCGYEPTSVRVIANPGVSSLPELLLEMHFDMNGRRFHFHLAHPRQPDANAADEAAFRAASVLASCASGRRLPPTTGDLQAIERRLAAAARAPVPLLVHAQHDGCVIMGQSIGLDDNERRIRHDIRLSGGALGIVPETDIRILEARLWSQVKERARMALPLAERYRIDPVLAAIMQSQGWTSSQLMDLIAGAVGKSPEPLDFDMFRVSMKRGRLRLEKWRIPKLSIDEHNMRIVGEAIPETVALALVGARFDRLASGTPFGDMTLLRVKASTKSVIVKVDREPLTLGSVVAMLGDDLHGGEWLDPGAR